MKKTLFLFAVVYAVFFSLGITCLLNLLDVAFAFGIDGWRVIEQHPRYIPFIIITGLLSLIAASAVFMLNLRYSKKVAFSKRAWIAELLCSFVVSIPMVFLWDQLFDFLQVTF